MPPCSKLSRRGLETSECASLAERRPTLTASARAGVRNLRSGRKKACGAVKQKKDDEVKKTGETSTRSATKSHAAKKVRISTGVHTKDPQFAQRFGPRGVLRCKATDRDDPTVDPRFGKVGMQTIVDTGPLTVKRMETADEEFLAATLDAMERAKAANRPFFIWHNTTRMHIWTHLQKKYQDMVAEKGLYGAGMTELDDQVGVLLKKLEDLGRCRRGVGWN
jgi:arylsulfatase A-like enzyme